ncbi:MAG: hypothetical protein MPJ24_11155, partial [Pirellulaceae bacterium]|nr:hypothetical protein [Pirellulaceae bacterium]
MSKKQIFRQPILGKVKKGISKTLLVLGLLTCLGALGLFGQERYLQAQGNKYYQLQNSRVQAGVVGQQQLLSNAAFANY